MKILALDLSLTSTGAAWNHDHDGGRHAVTLKAPTTGVARLVHLRNEIARRAAGVDLVVIEGYSMGTGRQESHAHGLGELGGVIRVVLHEAGIPYVEVAPAMVKKLATGRGNGTKNEVLTCAVRRLQYPGSSTDEADALWLLEAAAQWYQLPWRVTLPEANRTGLGKITWPQRPADPEPVEAAS